MTLFKNYSQTTDNLPGWRKRVKRRRFICHLLTPLVVFSRQGIRQVKKVTVLCVIAFKLVQYYLNHDTSHNTHAQSSPHNKSQNTKTS